MLAAARSHTETDRAGCGRPRRACVIFGNLPEKGASTPPAHRRQLNLRSKNQAAIVKDPASIARYVAAAGEPSDVPADVRVYDHRKRPLDRPDVASQHPEVVAHLSRESRHGSAWRASLGSSPIPLWRGR
jgi:hypothetical protein